MLVLLLGEVDKVLGFWFLSIYKHEATNKSSLGFEGKVEELHYWTQGNMNEHYDGSIAKD